MEDIEKVTPEQIAQLKGKFFDKVKANNPGMSLGESRITLHLH